MYESDYIWKKGYFWASIGKSSSFKERCDWTRSADFAIIAITQTVEYSKWNFSRLANLTEKVFMSGNYYRPIAHYSFSYRFLCGYVSCLSTVVFFLLTMRAATASSRDSIWMSAILRSLLERTVLFNKHTKSKRDQP